MILRFWPLDRAGDVMEMAPRDRWTLADLEAETLPSACSLLPTGDGKAVKPDPGAHVSGADSQNWLVNIG